MSSLSPCFRTVGDAHEKPIFLKGDARRRTTDVCTLDRIMKDTKLPPHWVALTSPRNMEYYYNPETKEMRLEKPQFPSESSEDGSRDFLKSVTGRKEFSPAFRLRIRRTADGGSAIREDLILGADLDEFDTQKAEPGTINLCFVASNTQENSIYASQETIECILNRYGLRTAIGRLGSSPQMCTYQFIRTMGGGDFVFTRRSVTAAEASTFLCYRYRHSDRSIFWLFLDRRERSEAFIDILTTLDARNGLPLLPALALSSFGLRANIRTLRTLEKSYYITKFMDTVSREIEKDARHLGKYSSSILEFLEAGFNAMYSQVESLEISTNAILALTMLVREMDLEKEFSELMNAIDSETRGNIEAAARTKARLIQRQHILTTTMQTTMVSLLQQCQEATAKQAEVLIATREASIASEQTLSTMVLLLQQSHEANIKQAEVLVATQKATLASTDTLGTMQELLAGTQELNRRAEEVARKAADYGFLVLRITFATFLAGCLSTCAESFSMWKWASRFSPIPMAVISIASIAFYFAKVKRIKLRAKKSSEVTENPSYSG